MRTLYLLRHAKAVAQDPAGDRERGLEERGRRAARAIAGWLGEQTPAPDLVLCSSAARTQATLDLVVPALVRAPRILYEDGLYLATARQLLARLRQIPPATGSALLIGHNPGIHELAILLADTGAGPLAARLADGFPTAALAAFELEVPWAALDRRRARLVRFTTPKELSRSGD